MESFFSTIYQNLMKLVHFDTVKAILVCSNGFINSNLLKFMDTQSLATYHVLHANLAKFVCVHSNSGHVHALNVGAGLQSES